MSIYYIKDGELYHHGVKGQKWGVRRYQNPNGSLTAEGKKRLANYKSREDKRIVRKYRTPQLAARTKKLETKYELDKDPRTKQKLDKARYKQLRNEGMQFVERSKVKNMSYNDMRNEQKTVNTARAKAFVKTTAGTLFIAAISGNAIPYVSTPKTSKMKTDMRVGSEKKERIEKSARKSSGYKGR